MDWFAAGSGIAFGATYKGHLGGVLAGCSFCSGVDQAHGQRPRGSDFFKPRQCLTISVDIRLQFRATVAEVVGTDKNGRNARIDHACIKLTDSRDLQCVDYVAGREEGFIFGIDWLHKVQAYFCRSKGHTVQFEIASFLNPAVADWHMGDNSFVNVGLPYTNFCNAIGRDTCRIHQSSFYRERADRGRQIAAVAAPVDKILVYCHLAKQIVNVMIRLLAGLNDNGFTGAGSGPAHAVDLFFVGIRATNNPLQ